MSLATPIYRLKPQSGDVTAHDELEVGAALDAGTLVDLGAGDFAWRIANTASAVIAARTTAGAVGGGVTIAVRMAVTTWPTASYDNVLGYSVNGTGYGQSNTFGKNSTNGVIRSRLIDTGTPTATMQTVGTVMRTYVYKSLMTSALDTINVWIDTVSRSGTGANFVSTGQNVPVRTYSQILIGSAGSIIDVADIVIWGEELSDADCAALADNGIRETLDTVPAGATTQITATTDDATFSGTSVGYVASCSTQITATTADAVFSGSAFVAAASGSFVTEPMVNNTGTIQDTVAVLYEWRVGTGIGVAPTSVNYGTGTTDASGVLTATGLASGTGALLVATTDRLSVYYQTGTVV